MSRRTRRALPLSVFAAASVLAAPAASPAAERFYTVTDSGALTSFQSDGPAALSTAREITGLQPGEEILALDLRPATQGLVGLGSSGRLYRLNPATARAQAIGANPFGPRPDAREFGFDFNPMADRIRLVSEADVNLRLNPDTGALAATDTPLSYAADDAAAGANPHVAASAYTNNRPGATATQLFGIDTVRRTLVLQEPPNAGILRTVAPLTVRGRPVPRIVGPVSFDITAEGAAFVAFRLPGDRTAALYGLNLRTGALTLRGPIGPLLPQVRTRGLAAAGPVADDERAPLVVFSAPGRQRLRNVTRDGLRFQISCDEYCEALVTLRLRGQSVARGVLVLAGASRGNLRIRGTSSAARAIRRSSSRRLVLQLVVTDAAGNVRRQSENVTLVP